MNTPTRLITDTGDAGRLLKYMQDAIPQGEHPNPHAEFVSIRLDVLQAAIDYLEWLEKGNAEWRAQALDNARQREAVAATARVAINHLQQVLNKPRTHDQQQRADTAARDWLTSIGSEPS